MEKIDRRSYIDRRKGNSDNKYCTYLGKYCIYLELKNIHDKLGYCVLYEKYVPFNDVCDKCPDYRWKYERRSGKDRRQNKDVKQQF